VNADNNLRDKSISSRKTLQAKYYTYNYEIPSAKFDNFISFNKLNQGIEVKNTLKEVYAVRVMNTAEFISLIKNLDVVFPERTKGSISNRKLFSFVLNQHMHLKLS
jgi:hypothetical protein